MWLPALLLFNGCSSQLLYTKTKTKKMVQDSFWIGYEAGKRVGKIQGKNECYKELIETN